jgi:cadmium resistance protein CadD (predicted permease)
LFYVFLVVCALIGIAIYLFFIVNLVPGASEERVGVLEPLPPDLGIWKADSESTAGRAAAANGLTREVRYYFYETRSQLVQQVRHRNPITGEIVRTERDEVIKRRRVRK